MLPVDARIGLAGRTGRGAFSWDAEDEADSSVRRPEPIDADRRSMGDGKNLVVFCSVVERLYD